MFKVQKMAFKPQGTRHTCARTHKHARVYFICYRCKFVCLCFFLVCSLFFFFFLVHSMSLLNSREHTFLLTCAKLYFKFQTRVRSGASNFSFITVTQGSTGSPLSLTIAFEQEMPASSSWLMIQNIPWWQLASFVQMTKMVDWRNHGFV